MDSQEFDDFLNKRHCPQAPSNLSQRIIDASRAQSQQKSTITFAERLRSFLDGFMAPQPAFALAMVVLLVIVLGVYSSDIVATPDKDAEIGDVSLAFYVDDIFGYEDYL